MDIKRTYPRCSIFGDGDMVISNGKKLPVKVKDMSASGCMITSDYELQMNELIHLSIHFTGIAQENNISVKGKVVRKEAVSNSFTYGIEILDLSPKQRVEIDEIMQMSCIHIPIEGANLCDDGGCIFHHRKRKLH